MTDAVTSDPMFEEIANNNCRVQASSPCINAGVNRAWMDNNDSRDFDGRSRIDRFFRRVDIGAYEYLAKGSLFTVR